MAEGDPHWPASPTGLSIAESAVAVCALRVHAPDEAIIESLGNAFALAWPSAPNTVAGDNLRVAWLAPGEWAILASAASVADRVASVCLGRLHHLVDMSPGRRIWRIAGPWSRTLIAKGCSLDIHPRVFGRGRCAQTLLAQVPILLFAPEDDQTFELLAEASLAGHLRAWFADAGSEFQA